MHAQVYTLERLAAGDLAGAGPLLGALAAALARLHKGTPEWAPFAATLARRLAVRASVAGPLPQTAAEEVKLLV